MISEPANHHQSMINNDSSSSAGASQVKRIVIVSSGKGGVGKSTVAAHLAASLWRSGRAVGLLDIDLTGPSMPRIIGDSQYQVLSVDDGWLPMYADKDGERPRFPVMSMGYAAAPGDSVVWRGPRRAAMVESMLTRVRWGALDYLVVDTPPGTSDEKITLCAVLRARFAAQVAGALLVTTPQMVSLSDVRKDISFYEKLQLPVLGLVENMSGLRCPRCRHVDWVFSSGGGQALAAARGVRYLGALPLLPALAAHTDSGRAFRDKWAADTLADSDADQSVQRLMAAIEAVLAPLTVTSDHGDSQ